MRIVGVVFGSSLVLALPARAIGPGFGNLPGWLDYYLLITVFAGLLAYVMTMLTKPADVSLLRLGGAELGMVTGFFYRLLKGVLLVFVALLVLGIGLMLTA